LLHAERRCARNLQDSRRNHADTVANMNTHLPTSSSIQSVEFGFLSTQDVRTLSVKRITNPTTFDSLLHPVAGGLHDAALGAFLDNP
jgi:hypothetical protein